MATSARIPDALDVAGDVFAPGNGGYDEARLAWNLAVDQRPSAVVVAESAADVVEAVRFARSRGMRIAPQGTGHGSAPLESLERAMLLKTSRMRRVDIDPGARTVRVEAGAEWQDVTVPAGRHGLAALAGSSPNVGVTGYTLGGGIGWLARRYGLAANSVTAVEVVTPDGRLARADAEHEPNLLWAVKGGGGSVGVVTALEMTLYPVRELYAGALFFPIERSADVLHAWREWTGTVPDEVTSVGRILRFPALPEVAERLRGRAFAVLEAAYLGDALAVVDGGLLADAPPAAIDALVALVGPDAVTPLLGAELRHLGGALARPAPGGGAQAAIDAKYAWLTGGLATTATGRAVRAHVRAVKDALTPWRAAYDYFNFAETPAEAGAVLSHDAYQRLREIKAAYDPDEAIVSAHPVRPAVPR
jgi:FAD/FMN-containing dehydrogenase